MLGQSRGKQFKSYEKTRSHFINNYDKLIQVEEFCMKKIQSFMEQNHDDIKRDYDEASLLYPFWQNYLSEEVARGPREGLFPWNEVGEHVFCSKLLRFLSKEFDIRDSGLPTVSSSRCIISSNEINKILKITSSVWLFVDAKSIGPREDIDSIAVTRNQVSGNGKWVDTEFGIENDIMIARGPKSARPFHCAVSPIFILSDGTIVPVVHVFFKHVYKTLKFTKEGSGHPLNRVSLISIPNGILLTEKPNYLKVFPELVFPGKDDKGKDPRKVHAGINFEKLREVAEWRYKDFYF